MSVAREALSTAPSTQEATRSPNTSASSWPVSTLTAPAAAAISGAPSAASRARASVSRMPPSRSARWASSSSARASSGFSDPVRPSTWRTAAAVSSSAACAVRAALAEGAATCPRMHASRARSVRCTPPRASAS
ncbi:hypothetical protein SBADM41S_06905 [Streptomyces badius]